MAVARFVRVSGRVAAVGLALSLTACSAGSGTESDPSSAEGGSAAPSSAAAAASPAAAPTPGPGVDPEVFALAMLSPEELEAQLASLTATLERDLWTQTGLEDELGGPAAADAAFAALTSALIEEAAGAGDEQWFGRFGALIRAENELSTGGLLFATLLLAQLGPEAAVKSTNGLKPGEEVKGGDSSDGDKSFEVSGTLSQATLKTIVDMTKDGVNGKLRVTMDIAPCPDANGVFKAKVLLESSSTTEGGRTGSNASTEVSITGRVDDNAELTGYDSSNRTQAAQFKSSRGAYVDVSSSTSFTGKEVTAATREVNRTAGKATPEFVQQWTQMGTMFEFLVAREVLKAAEQGWKSGRCVEVQVTTDPGKRRGLKPSSPVSILAAPKSKIDGSPTKGTVVAALSGGTSVDPTGTPVPADATFAYVAPAEKDDFATVKLEAKSRRGIGKAEVSFDTRPGKGYFIGATGGKYTQQGPGIGSITENASTLGTTTPTDICDITVPFELVNPDLGGRQVFTPTSPTGGTTSYTLKHPLVPFEETGKGTYTLELDGERGTIRTKVRGKYTFTGSGQFWKTSATQVFSLEPTDNCP